MENQKLDGSVSSSLSSLEICGLCGHANPLDQRFCGQCGAELKAYLQRMREVQRGMEEGPQIQVTFLYGAFGESEGGVRDPEMLDKLRKRLMGRFRLVVTERGAKFEDMGRGRFSATLGIQDPTEEDPLDAVTLGLKLLRLSAVAPQLPPLRLVATTGRIAKASVEKPLVQDQEVEEITGGHSLLRLANKVVWHCPVGGLMVDGLTYRMIRDTHRCKRFRLGGGVVSSTPLYEVESSVDATGASYEPPLVGREREIARMVRVFERVEVGEGPIFLTLTGELGIGKTRLLTAFQQQISGRAMLFRNPRERRRIDRWRRTPYSYFAEILRAFFEIYENEEDELSRQKLVQGILSTTTEQSDGRLREMTHLIGLLCQVDFPDSPYVDVEREDPTQLERRAFTALTNYLERAATRRPIVFLLDNLYSADTSSIRLLKHLAQYLESAPVLFVCGSRSSLLAKLEEESSLILPGERLILRPLSEEAARKMLTSLLPERVQLSEEVITRVLSIAEGNPFFLRECLRDINEQGLSALTAEGGAEHIDIPGSIEGILQARISRLQPDERDILQKAAVFGRSFWRGGVEMLLRYEGEIKPGWRVADGVLLDRDDDAEDILTRLEAQGVIQMNHTTTFEGEAQYSFVPSLLQELVYQELSEKLLPAYHRLAAQWLELVARNKHQDLGADIAHHLELGELSSRAALYWLELGQRAVKAFSLDIAIEHLEKALKHLDGTLTHKRVEGLRALAEAYLQQGRYADSMRSFEQLLSLSWQMGQRVLAAEVYTRMGWVAFLMRDFDKSLELLKNGHCLHQESDYIRGVAMALSHMGKVYTVLGDYVQARLYLQEALDIRRQLQHAGDLAWTLNDVGNLFFEQGDLAEARRYHQESLELRRRIGHTPQLLQSMNNLALLHVARGDYDAALSELLDILELAEKTGDKLALAVVLANLGEVYLFQGELSASAHHLERAIQIAGKLSDTLILAECYRLYGELALEREAPLVALDCCGTAYRLVTERGIRSAMASIYRLMGQAFAAIPSDTLERERYVEGERKHLPAELFGQARACLEESIATARSHGNTREEAKSRLEIGVYEAEQGSIARGRYQVEQARTIFTRLGMEFYRQLAERMLEDIDAYQQEEGTHAVDVEREDKAPTIHPAAQTIQFRVTFDDNELGPAPTPAEDIVQEGDIGAVMEQASSSLLPVVTRPTHPQHPSDTAESLAPKDDAPAKNTSPLQTQEAEHPAQKTSEGWRQDSDTMLSLGDAKEPSDPDDEIEQTVSLMAGDLDDPNDIGEAQDEPEPRQHPSPNEAKALPSSPAAAKLLSPPAAPSKPLSPPTTASQKPLSPSAAVSNAPLRLSPPASLKKDPDAYEDLETNLHLKPSNEALLPEDNYPAESLDGLSSSVPEPTREKSTTTAVSQTSDELPSLEDDSHVPEKTMIAPVHVVEALAQASVRDTGERSLSGKNDALVDAFSEADHDDEWTERKTMRMQGLPAPSASSAPTVASLPTLSSAPTVSSSPAVSSAPTVSSSPADAKTDGEMPVLVQPPTTASQHAQTPTAKASPSASQATRVSSSAIPQLSTSSAASASSAVSAASATAGASPKKPLSPPTKEATAARLPFPMLSSPGMPNVSNPAHSIPEMPSVGQWNPNHSIHEMPGIPMPQDASALSNERPPARALPGTPSYDDLPGWVAPEEQKNIPHMGGKLPFPSLSRTDLPSIPPPSMVAQTTQPPASRAKDATPPTSIPAHDAPTKKSDSYPPEEILWSQSSEKIESFAVEEDPRWQQKQPQDVQPLPQKPKVSPPPPPPQALKGRRTGTHAPLESAAPISLTPAHGHDALSAPPSSDDITKEKLKRVTEPSTPPAGVPAFEEDPSFLPPNPQQALQAALGQSLSFDTGEPAEPVDPSLFSKTQTKKPSVYDSQMIIAQVAQDDDISRGWFEEGRSDRTRKFWKERPEDREGVREELQHERILQELEKMDEKKPKK